MSNLARITQALAAQAEAAAGDLLHQLSPEGKRHRRRARDRRRAALARMARRSLIAAFAIIVGAIAFGMIVGPLGIEGLMAVAMLMLLAIVAIVLFSSSGRETPATLAASDLPLLPARAEEWLAARRATLPAPAARLTDAIALRLEAIAPQLVGLDPNEPAAAEVRKLIAVELPELVDGYARVPEQLRATAIDGFPSPDRQLSDGLQLVDQELRRMCEQLSRGDLHKLATQGRYLELKYRGAGGGRA